MFKIPERGDKVIDHNRITKKEGEVSFFYTTFIGEFEIAEEVCVQFSNNRLYPLVWYPGRAFCSTWDGNSYNFGADDGYTIAGEVYRRSNTGDSPR